VLGQMISELKVNSQKNCFTVTPEQMRRLQTEVAVSTQLGPGINIVKIRSLVGRWPAAGQKPSAASSASGPESEPWVLLWIYGGKVINQQTHVEVQATWASLNGYADVLTLEVKEAAQLCAFFFAAPRHGHDGSVTLSIAHI
jgi:hypothetical protein